MDNCSRNSNSQSESAITVSYSGQDGSLHTAVEHIPVCLASSIYKPISDNYEELCSKRNVS